MTINGGQINSIWRNRPAPRQNIIVDGTYETVDKNLIIEKIFPLYWSYRIFCSKHGFKCRQYCYRYGSLYV